MITKAIYGYRQAFPDVKLVSTEHAGCAQPTALMDHALDLCFVRGVERPAMDASIQATRILQERLVVVMRPDHRFAQRETRNLRNLEGEPLLLYSREDGATFTEDLMGMLREVCVEPVAA